MTRQDQQNARILIVEDEYLLAADLESSLCRLGFHVIGNAGTAAEAIDAASRERPDLILMDIRLDGFPAGIDIANTVRDAWNIPVVFVTAYAGDEIIERARMAGAYGFLTKPFRLEDLNATILIALQQHRLEVQLFAEQNWLTTILNSLSDGVIATDTLGRVRYMNPAAAQMTRWPSAEALGKTIEEVLPVTRLNGETAPQGLLRQALHTRQPAAQERFLLQVRGQGTLPVQASGAPIIQDSQLLGAVTIFLDISRQLQLEDEQQQEQGRLKTEVLRFNAALGRSQEELRALSGRLLSSQEEERRRVARELHDDLGQRVALMNWRVSELAKHTEALSPEAHQQVASLHKELLELDNGLRSVSHQLHPSAIADLGLASALRAMVEQQRATGTDVTLITHAELPAVSIEASTALYRIAQEALRNAMQHAPGSPVLMSLHATGAYLELRIEDPGPGFDPAQPRGGSGLGLLSMQERALLLGGTFSLATAPGDGTTVTVRLPCQTRPGS